jgi:hypothetical protein
MRPVIKTIRDPSLWVKGEEYFDRLYEAIGTNWTVVLGSLQ